jgi:flavin reductase (NADH)
VRPSPPSTAAGQPPTDKELDTGTGQPSTDTVLDTGTGQPPTDTVLDTGAGQPPTDTVLDPGARQPQIDAVPNTVAGQQPRTDSVVDTGTGQPRTDAVRSTDAVHALADPVVDTGAGQALAGPVFDTAQFFAIMGAFPTGVTIITTLDADGQPRGLTSNAVCSVSADPPLLLVCVDRRSRTLTALVERGQFVVNFLVAERGDLSNRLASKEPDKFAGVSWRPAGNSLPWLHADSLAHAECTIVQTIQAGDHVIVVGRVDDGQPPPPGSAPLMYFRRGYGTWPSSDGVRVD